MKIKSQALYNYLQQAGVLNSTPEALALAKKQYRAQYKRCWRKQKYPLNEIRFGVTASQYQAIKAAALQANTKPTNYVRNIILSAANSTPFIIQKDMLLQVLQLVSMVINSLQNDHKHVLQIAKLLEQAEQKLLTYLNIHSHEERK